MTHKKQRKTNCVVDPGRQCNAEENENIKDQRIILFMGRYTAVATTYGAGCSSTPFPANQASESEKLAPHFP
ncbi:hypothetical protein NECAME_00587 [Necator americanus]|uniref:Uncharacterized protein n=1 Tax=Necator americanus TaxID=51031 RepID=W2T1R0_NECAM|nr:hypothetical protein NECAME_00587 [Necator americanus]ETN75176.1 hypothetical protein NECAME_00587 [Necator americanus]